MVEVKVNKEQSIIEMEYPIIMFCNSLIVLFNKHECGTVLRANYLPAGYYSDDWDMSIFEDFKGEITLKNN